MKGELVGKIITGFAAFSSKTYSYLIVDNDGNKKAKHTTKRCVIKQNLNSKIIQFF